ncbi:MAG: heme-copper oxidase subunit III [Haloarculaceae archaeon]
MTGSTATAESTVDGHVDEGEHHEHRSRWPFVAAAGAGLLYTGAALFLLAAATGVAPEIYGLAVAAVGVGGLVSGLAGWVYQGFVADYWTTAPGTSQAAYLTTTVLFLGTDVATFSAGFVYYFFIRAQPWPPAHLPELLSSLVLINTGVLVASSVTLHVAHELLERGRRRLFLGVLGLTVLMGIGFLAGQAYEYYGFVVEEGFTLSTGIFGSAFFGLTGLHGFHVFMGVVFLSIVFLRGLAGQYSDERDTSIATASLYWHFVDAVWLLLVVVLYGGATL